MQNDIMNAIRNVLINEIKSQINDAKFVSIILNEPTDIMNKFFIEAMYMKDSLNL